MLVQTENYNSLVQDCKVVKTFPWSNKHDRVWIQSKDIHCKIEKQIVTRKVGRILCVSDDIMEFLGAYNLRDKSF